MKATEIESLALIIIIIIIIIIINLYLYTKLYHFYMVFLESFVKLY